ncbi:MAG: winged helix DNA-binding domain-containing protein, partial [Caldiserica bacterium]|nr:winged helix DNA-binding domain-containing protein [Caldisericota bacterium]
QGDLLMVGSKGARPVFARRDSWLPDLHFRPRTRIKSLEELLVRYLRTFAPATLSDFAHWTGLPMATVRDTATRAAGLLVSVAVEGRGTPLLALAEDADVLQKPLPHIPVVTLLPKFDAMLLAWKDPSRVLDGGDHGAVFRPAGQIEAVVLLHGHAAATWRMKQTPGSMHVTVTPVRHVGGIARRQVEAAFEHLGSWAGARSTTVTWQD